MARGKKTGNGLTPEEKLAQALVPVEEQPYKVPENWCWTYLFKGAAECMDSFRKPVNATERAGREGDIPYYGATGQVGWIDDFLTDEELVLLGEDGAPFLDPIKDKAYLISGKAWVNNHAHILRSYYGSVGNQYLVNYLNTFNYKGYVNGTTRLKLTQASMDILPVPIPPLAEQRRIVDRIEYLFAKLDEAREKAQSVLNSFETRKAAILHKAFTGELTVQWRAEQGLGVDSWDKKPLAELTYNHDSRRIPLSQAERNNLERRYDYYGASGVIDRVDRFLFEGRNLLIGEDGANLVTRSKPIAFIADGKYWVNNHAHVLSTKTEMVLDFLCYYINSIDLTPHVTGSAQPKMTQAKMNGIPIPVPTVSEQTEIVRILDSLFAKEQRAKEAAEAVLEKIDLLKKSILARSFRGELGTNAPTEESAVELLKAIL